MKKCYDLYQNYQSICNILSQQLRFYISGDIKESENDSIGSRSRKIHLVDSDFSYFQGR